MQGAVLAVAPSDQDLPLECTFGELSLVGEELRERVGVSYVSLGVTRGQ